MRSRSVTGMELDLVPGGDESAVEATRLAAAAVGLRGGEPATRRPWWRAGVEEAVAAREATLPAVTAPTGSSEAAARYAAPSPRRTRGATRA